MMMYWCDRCKQAFSPHAVAGSKRFYLCPVCGGQLGTCTEYGARKLEEQAADIAALRAEFLRVEEERDLACAEATRLSKERTYVFGSVDLGDIMRMCGRSGDTVYHLEEESANIYRVEYCGGYRQEFIKADHIEALDQSRSFYLGDDLVAEFSNVVSIMMVEGS